MIEARGETNMGFKQISARYLEPVSQALTIIGIAALCQPWDITLHSYGITITLVGLIGFSIFSKIKPGPESDSE
jgi:hypothetical protein